MMCNGDFFGQGKRLFLEGEGNCDQVESEGVFCLFLLVFL